MKIRHHQTKTDTHGGIIMCSEFCAMQSFTKYNSVANADNHKNNISGIQFVKEKASATTINTAKTQRKTFYGDLAGANDWTVFFELPELKEHSIKHFPQDICQTK